MLEISDSKVQRIRKAAAYVRGATLFCLLAMFLGTHLPGIVSPSFSMGDKLLHYWAYCILALCILASWELSKGPLQPIHFFTVWLACTIYGAFDEITQLPVGRSCDGIDWLFDIMGIITGLALFRIARPLLYQVILRKAVVSR